jgi:hypothetical protein
LSVEVLDLDGSSAVELDDLIIGVEGTSTVDERCTAGLFEGDGIFADIGPPDVVQSANKRLELAIYICSALNLPSSLAVNTLGLRSTDDDVGKSSTVLKNEHGVLLTSL